jgi:secreted trypsin-like serine protease
MRSGKLSLALAVLLSVCSPIALALRPGQVGRGPHRARYATSRDARRLRSGARSAQTHTAPRAHESIIGGAAAVAGAFPSLAYIVDFQGKLAYQCTGTVVAPSLILTAGHCAENMRTGVVNEPSGYRVVTGTIDPLTAERQVSTVLGVLVYPGLMRRVDDGDAALLVLSTPIAAPAITLAPAFGIGKLAGGSPATIAGWGRTSYLQRPLTETLQWADTVKQGRRWFRRNAPPYYAKSEICTITPPTYATGVCEGDSGGPLLARGPNGVSIQVGIAVHVYARCSTRHPSVFASVRSISAWVHTWIDAYKTPPPAPAPSAPPSFSPPSSTAPSLPTPSPAA